MTALSFGFLFRSDAFLSSPCHIISYIVSVNTVPMWPRKRIIAAGMEKTHLPPFVFYFYLC